MKSLRPYISYITVLFIFFGKTTFAQNVYIKTDIIRVSGASNDAGIDAMLPNQKQTTYTYLNGLDAPLQKVSCLATVNDQDIIQPYQYDQWGQRSIDYLPYADYNRNNPSGSYRNTALADQQNYYTSNNTSINANAVANDAMPFNQKLFENSPLYRMMGIGNYGSGFQPAQDDNSQHYTVISYRSNTSADKVMINPVTSNTVFYSANALSVTDFKDGDGVEVLVFKNSNGQTFLKRQVSGQANEPYYDTYYIYNPDGNVAFIIPPKASFLISSGTTNVNAAPLCNLIYRYGYDQLGRLITRKVPNSGVKSFIYDPMNRIVLVQDGNQGQTGVNQWYYIKYDAANRPISRGIYTDNNNLGQAVMQRYVDTNYGSVNHETRSSDASNKYYTNFCFPSQNLTPLAFAYYDDYDLTQIGSAFYQYQVQDLGSEEPKPTANTGGMMTMILKRSIGSGINNVWLTNVYFYDKHSNIIQIQSNNHLNLTPFAVTDFTTYSPDFTGKPQVIKITKVTGAGTVNTNTVVSAIAYDDKNVKVKSIVQTYNNQAPKLVSSYDYNDFGQLITKHLGGNGSGCFLQNLDYRYNIRGQLSSINNSTLSNDGGITNSDNADIFGMTYLYDVTDLNLSNQPSYTGRVTAVKWMFKYNNGASTSNEKSYVYQYDNLGQLNGARYAERAPASSTYAFNLNMHNYDESGIAYDDDGNITRLQRNAADANGTSAPLDNLTYTPDVNYPDRLYQVSDAVPTVSSSGFNNLDNPDQTKSYQYDANGNLTQDPYKNISIEYNLINKIDNIAAPDVNNSAINYSYDASGTVLKKQISKNGAVQNTTDYIDDFVYTNGVISYFNMPEGRVVNLNGTLAPEYIIADAQGNARFSFQDNGACTPLIIQENSYYGFGEVMPGSLVPQSSQTAPNNNLYNGNSEWQNEFANLPDYYQSGSRNYDPALGRFISVDPMAEDNESLNVYHYAMNNPVMFNDPTGNDPDGNDGEYTPSPSAPPTFDSPDIDMGAGGGGDPDVDYTGNNVPSSATAYGGNYNSGDFSSSQMGDDNFTWGVPSSSNNDVAGTGAIAQVNIVDTPIYSNSSTTIEGVQVNGKLLNLVTVHDIRHVKRKKSSTSIFNEIKAEFTNVPYLYGGTTIAGCDCSGALQTVTHSKKRFSTRAHPYQDPEYFHRIDVPKTSLQSFISALQYGDLLVWPNHHMGFYDGSGYNIWNAHGKTGTPAGVTPYLYSPYIKDWGYPIVYRQNDDYDSQ